MAQYFLSHAGATSSTTPPTGFTERWSASGSWGQNTDCAEHVASGANNFDFLSWDTPGDVSGDAEILVLFRTNSATGNNSGVVVQGSTSATDGYYITLAGSGTTIQISRADAGSEATFTDAAFTWSANTDYWIRAGRSGNDIRARVWADGGSEPGTWTVTLASDTTYSSGRLGYFARYGFADSQFDQIGVGTGADSAPSSASSGSDGSITATATVTGTGAATASAAGSVTSTATVTGVGAASTAVAFSSSGVATVTGSGASIASGAFDADATATEGGIGGVLTMVGDGLATIQTVGSITVASSVVGRGQSTAAGDFYSQGVATVTGVNGSTSGSEALGYIAATATVQGVGASVVSAAGSITAECSVTGVGAAQVVADGDIDISLSMIGASEASSSPVQNTWGRGRARNKQDADEEFIMDIAAMLVPHLDEFNQVRH
jgi:hypothetical protein